MIDSSGCPLDVPAENPEQARRVEQQLERLIAQGATNEAKIEAIGEKLEVQIDGVASRLDTKMDALGERLKAVEGWKDQTSKDIEFAGMVKKVVFWVSTTAIGGVILAGIDGRLGWVRRVTTWFER